MPTAAWRSTSAHCDAGSWACSKTIRAARSRSSGEYLVRLDIGSTLSQKEPSRKLGTLQSPLIFLPASVLGVLVGYLPAFKVLMVWVYDRTGSLPIAMLMHVSTTADLFLRIGGRGVGRRCSGRRGQERAALATTAPESGGVKEAGRRRRTLRVAAIQMIAAPGESESNRARAETLGAAQ